MNDGRYRPIPLVSLILIALLLAVCINLAFASDDDDSDRTDNDPVSQDQAQDQYQDQAQEQNQLQDQLQEQGQGQDQIQEQEASASVTDSSTVDQNINIDNRRPGNSYIGGGDSTAHDQKVFAIGGGWLTGNASIRFDLTDKEARALRVARDWRADGRIQAADRLQCSLKIVHKPFGSSEDCFNALNPPEAPDLSGIYNQSAQSGWLLAEVTEEEYIAQQEMIADKFAQYDSLIEEKELKHQADDVEIARLKRVAEELAAAEQARKDKEAARRAAARAALEKENDSE
jgi:hypothetical protein